MISEELKSQLQEAQFLLSRFKELCSVDEWNILKAAKEIIKMKENNGNT